MVALVFSVQTLMGTLPSAMGDAPSKSNQYRQATDASSAKIKRLVSRRTELYSLINDFSEQRNEILNKGNKTSADVARYKQLGEYIKKHRNTVTSINAEITDLRQEGKRYRQMADEAAKQTPVAQAPKPKAKKDRFSGGRSPARDKQVKNRKNPAPTVVLSAKAYTCRNIESKLANGKASVVAIFDSNSPQDQDSEYRCCPNFSSDGKKEFPSPKQCTNSKGDKISGVTKLPGSCKIAVRPEKGAALGSVEGSLFGCFETSESQPESYGGSPGETTDPLNSISQVVSYQCGSDKSNVLKKAYDHEIRVTAAGVVFTDKTGHQQLLRMIPSLEGEKIWYACDLAKMAPEYFQRLANSTKLTTVSNPDLKGADDPIAAPTKDNGCDVIGKPTGDKKTIIKIPVEKPQAWGTTQGNEVNFTTFLMSGAKPQMLKVSADQDGSVSVTVTCDKNVNPAQKFVSSSGKPEAPSGDAGTGSDRPDH